MCKGCECHEKLESRGLGFNGDYRSRGHWCMAQITFKYPNGEKASVKDKLYMSYKEYLKTPEWCPKKQEIYKFGDIECPVLEVKTGIYR